MTINRTLLIVTEAAFYPPYRGDSSRLFALITNLRKRDWKVAVVALHDAGQPDIDYPAMEKLCDELFIYYPTQSDLARRNWNEMDSYCPEGLVSLVQHVADRLEPQVLVSQFVFLSRCLQVELASNAPGVKVIDADNIFTDRYAQYRSKGLSYDWFSTDAKQERAGLLRADIILAIQEREAEYFARLVPERPTLLLPHLHEVCSQDTPSTEHLFFVGAANPENAKGVNSFLKTAWPIIRQHHPNVRLKIAGRVCDLIEGCWHGVEFLGLVDNLTPLYEDAAIVLNPTPTGTGLKIKTVEALCHGKCLVATRAGIQGLENYPEIYCLAEGPEEFAVEIIWLLDQPSRIKQISQRARRFASGYFDPAILLRRFEDCVLNHLQRAPAFHNETHEAARP